jgi:2-aminoadipate transaminase
MDTFLAGGGRMGSLGVADQATLTSTLAAATICWQSLATSQRREIDQRRSLQGDHRHTSFRLVRTRHQPAGRTAAMATIRPPVAERMQHVKASEIRELLKLTSRPGVISFAGGLPASELFPAAELALVTSEVLQREGSRALQYSATEGDPDLRRHIAARMNAKQGTSVTADHILITSGSQQGLEFTGKIFLDPGDVVLCESPTYVGAINAWLPYEPRFVAIATDDEGMLPEALEQALTANRPVKLIYAIPDFQNPSGRTWSLARRQALIELATRHNVPVVEDSPYAELRFEGEPLPALKALDRADLVIFLGTFSKTFCPGLRCAWLAAPADFLRRYVLVKQGADLHTGTLVQRQVAAYLDRFGLDANIARVTAAYRERRDRMVAILTAELPAAVTFTRPAGGLFLWVTFPGEVNGRDLLERCLQDDVAFVPGGAFFPDPGHENHARLNFSFMPPEQIEIGARRFCAAVREFLG